MHWHADGETVNKTFTLGSADIIAFVPTRNPAKARAFYEKTLGLRFVSEDPFALVFDSKGVTIRIANVSSVKGFKPAAYTILGWQVRSAREAVQNLSKKGIKFERFEGMEQDELGIWDSPSGARVAWFKDPDGNTLSVTEA
jgi:catechol 2,3-dioxygenase-like lactoylglutathione lyase family enzyme